MKEQEEKILKEKQMRAFEDTRDALEHDTVNMHIEAPTGFGKTVLFGQIVAAFDTTTTIVVPSEDLVEQTYESLTYFNPDLSVGRVYGKKKEYGKQVTVTTYASLVLNSNKEDELRNRLDANLVVFDEMHEAISEKRLNAGETFPNAIFLGLSATPIEVTDEEFADKRITQMTKNKVHRVAFREAVEEGYLSGFSAYLVEVDRDISNVRINSNGDYDEKELELVINEKTANQAAVRFFQEMKKRDVEKQREKKRRKIEPLVTSVYASSVAHAQELAREFNASGIRAAVVWGEQNNEERREIMKQWRNGEIEVVCSKNLLVRGIDLPGMRMVINVTPTASETVEKQRSGRGLRIYEPYPDKHTIIADFIYQNTNRKNPQVTFPQVAEATTMTRGKVNGENGGSGSEDPVPKPEIEIEGLRVITNHEEIMRIVREMSEKKYQLAPEGWMVVGHKQSNFTLTNVLNRSREWVVKYLPTALEVIKKEQDNEGISLDEREELQGMFLDQKGQLRTYYSPQVMEQLKKMVDIYSPIPPGWLPIGSKQIKNTICNILDQTPQWVRIHISETLEAIKKEQDDQKVPLDERDELYDTFFDIRNRQKVYYSTIIVDRLKEVLEKSPQPPEEWLLMGTKELEGSLVSVLGRDRTWIESHLFQAIELIQSKRKEKGLNEEPLTGYFWNNKHQRTKFYSPLILEELRNQIPKLELTPEGWLTVGDKQQDFTLAGVLGRGRKWILSHIPQAIENIQREQTHTSFKDGEKLTDEYLNRSNRPETFYSPKVIKMLRIMAEKEEREKSK